LYDLPYNCDFQFTQSHINTHDIHVLLSLLSYNIHETALHRNYPIAINNQGSASTGPAYDDFEEADSTTIMNVALWPAHTFICGGAGSKVVFSCRRATLDESGAAVEVKGQSDGGATRDADEILIYRADMCPGMTCSPEDAQKNAYNVISAINADDLVTQRAFEAGGMMFDNPGNQQPWELEKVAARRFATLVRARYEEQNGPQPFDGLDFRACDYTTVREHIAEATTNKAQRRKRTDRWTFRPPFEGKDRYQYLNEIRDPNYQPDPPSRPLYWQLGSLSGKESLIRIERKAYTGKSGQNSSATKSEQSIEPRGSNTPSFNHAGTFQYGNYSQSGYQRNPGVLGDHSTYTQNNQVFYPTSQYTSANMNPYAQIQHSLRFNPQQYPQQPRSMGYTFSPANNTPNYNYQTTFQDPIAPNLSTHQHNTIYPQQPSLMPNSQQHPSQSQGMDYTSFPGSQPLKYNDQATNRSPFPQTLPVSQVSSSYRRPLQQNYPTDLDLVDPQSRFAATSPQTASSLPGNSFYGQGNQSQASYQPVALPNIQRYLTKEEMEAFPLCSPGEETDWDDSLRRLGFDDHGGK